MPEFDDDPMTENTHLNQTGKYELIHIHSYVFLSESIANYFLGPTGWNDDESNHPVSVATFGMNKFGRMIRIYL